MVKKFGFENIRVFKDYQEFDIRPLTVLTGPNNSGKSTVGKVLRLIHEGYFEYYSKNMSIDQLCFPQNLKNNIGGFIDNRTRFSEKGYIGLSLFAGDIEFRLKYKEINEKAGKADNSFEYQIRVKHNMEAVLEQIEVLIKGCLILKLTGEIYPHLPFSPNVIDNTFWKCMMDNSYAHNLKRVLIDFKNEKIKTLKEKVKDLKYFRKNASDLLKDTFKSEFKSKIRKGQFYEKNLNEHKDLLFSFEPFEPVFSDKDFFTKDNYLNQEHLNLRKKLEILEINDYTTFLEKYIDFEERLIFELYKIVFKDLFSTSNEQGLDFTFPFPLNSILNGTTADRLKEIDELSLLKSISNLLSNFLIHEYSHGAQDMNIHEPSLHYPLKDKMISFIEVFRILLTEYFKKLHNGLYNALNSDLYHYDQSQEISDVFLTNNNLANESVFYEFAFKYINGSITDDAFGFVKKWLRRLQICDDIKIEKIKVEGKEKEIGYSYSILKNGKSYLLSENGLGVRKLLEILLTISMNKVFDLKNEENKEFRKIIPESFRPNSASSIYILEEPESNLHPRFQSLLAEVLIDAMYFFSLKFVVETHSEYFIRKLQYLTAKKKLEPKDAAIYYFNTPGNVPNGEKQVKEIKILKDGSLSDNFGQGFFDEADNIALELYRIQRKNLN